MGIPLYPKFILKEDLSPDNLGSEIDDICTDIHKACKGWGTDEKGLIEALASHNHETRAKISVRFKQMFEDEGELKDVMKSECGIRSDFGVALQLLAVPLDVAECEMITKATKGLGTDELLLYPIVIGRTNDDIQLLKKRYFELTGDDLGQHLDSELGGEFEKLVFTCLQGAEEKYDAEYHTEEKVSEDVETLYEMGQGSWGTDEEGLFKILCCSPPEHLKKVNAAYADKYGYTLIKAIEDEFSGKTKEAALFMIKMKLRPYEAVAELIDKACKGFGTNELLLTCVITRYQGILKEVDAAHQELYDGQGIVDRVKSETSGDYERLLVQLIESA